MAHVSHLSLPGQEVLHVGALLVFQNVLGALPLLPQPTLESTKPKIITDRQATEKLPQTKGNWARILLAAARGETMSEAEKALQKLQLELEVMRAFVTPLYFTSPCRVCIKFLLLCSVTLVHADSRFYVSAQAAGRTWSLPRVCRDACVDTVWPHVLEWIFLNGAA